ncbi:MAG: hypothetical protein AAB434_02875 [Planctomycetota bacterium]
MSPRNSIALLSLLLVLLSAAPALANRGGPDEGGYFWVDNVPDGFSDPLNDVPAFAPRNYTLAGANNPFFTLGDEELVTQINLGFPFTFYGTIYNGITLSSNGFLSFLQQGITTNPVTSPMPSLNAPNALVAFHWNDMNPANIQNTVFFGQGGNAPDRVWCTDFVNVPMRGGAPPGFVDNTRTCRVQAALEETTNDIFFYITRWCANTTTLTTLGIENQDGTMGTQYARFGSPPDTQTIFRAVRFTLTDVIPPNRTTDLTGAIVATCPPRIRLTWTAPGDDGGGNGRATQYEIRFSTTGPVTEANFATSTPIPGTVPGPAGPGSLQSFVVQGLDDETDYWFALRTRDERLGHFSFVSNSIGPIRTLDCEAPARVIDLSVSGITTTTVSLQWTAPGDNGNSTVGFPDGRAMTYDLRQRLGSAVNDVNFTASAVSTTNPALARPLAAGTQENYQVTGLTPDEDYFFGLRTSDEVPNTSPTSNSPRAHTSDIIPPATTTDLTVIAQSGSSITLRWTVPGDNGNGADGKRAAVYDIRYRTSGAILTMADFNGATSVIGEPPPATPTPLPQTQTFQVPGLAPETTYFFAMITRDEVPLSSGLSNSPTGTTLDTTAPARVTNLFTTGTTGTTVTLIWTAVGDNGLSPIGIPLGGRASTYDLRYLIGTPVTEANFAGATQVVGEPAPQAVGTQETFTVTGLLTGNQYYFGLRVIDEVPNSSPVSNSPYGQTGDVVPPSQITNLRVTGSTGATISLAWTAPGDDGAVGQANFYELRMRTDVPITAANFATSTLLNPMPPFPNAPVPTASGTTQTFTVGGLAPLTGYWFAIVSFDTVPNPSLVSNSPLGVTQAPSFTGVGGSTTGGGVSNSPLPSVFPCISFDAAGTPFVAWADDSGGRREIYTRILNGASWAEMPLGSATGTGLTGATTGAADHPSLGRSAAGNPYLAYEEQNGADRDIFVRAWNGAAWNALGGDVSANANESLLPSIALGVGEFPGVAWQDGADPSRHEIFYRRWTGALWGGLSGSETGAGLSNTLGDSIDPSLAFDAAGNPVVAWADDTNGNWEIYARRHDGVNWVEMAGSATGGGVSNTAAASFSPSIAVDGTGNIVIAWSETVGAQSEIFARRFDGAAWVEAGTGAASGGGISRNPGQSFAPDISVDTAGTPYLSWHDGTSGNFEVYGKRFDGVNLWKAFSGNSASGGGISNTAGESANTCCALRSTTDFFVTWSDLTPGQYEVYVATIPIVDTTDGADELVIGPGTGGAGRYQIIDNAAAGFAQLLPLRLMPFGPYNAANGAVHTAMGDINNDGLDEVILGIGTFPQNGGWIETRRDGFGRNDHMSWLRVPWTAYNARNGLVRPCAANIDDDPEAEIVFGLGTSGAGIGGAFDDANRNHAFLGWFTAGTAGYRSANGEVRVAAGDVDGDGRDELVIGFGVGGAGRVEIRDDRTANWATLAILTIPFPAYNSARGAVWPAAGDVDGDGRAEAVLGLEKGGNGLFFVFDDQTGGFAPRGGGRMAWSGYNGALGEVRPAVGDFDGDLRGEVALTTGVYPTAGGFVEFMEDQLGSFRHVTWRRYDDVAYRNANGELFPAAGNCR